MTQPDNSTSPSIDGAAPRDDVLVAGPHDDGMHQPGMPPGGGQRDPSPSRVVYRRKRSKGSSETPSTSGQDTSGAPAESASKQVWVEHAVNAHGVDRDAAEGMTKADLIAAYGAS